PVGPSPSELVGASTMSITQPGGASLSRRASPPPLNAQFLDVAARSMTRCLFSSVNVHPIDVFARQQRSHCNVELSRGTGELELERAILWVVEHTMRIDADAVRVERRCHFVELRRHAGADRRTGNSPRSANV